MAKCLTIVVVIIVMCKNVKACDGDYLIFPMARLPSKSFVSFELLNQFLTVGGKVGFLQLTAATCFKKDHPFIETQRGNWFFDGGINWRRYTVGMLWGGEVKWSNLPYGYIPVTFCFYLTGDVLTTEKWFISLGVRAGYDFKEGFVCGNGYFVGIKTKLRENLYTVGEISRIIGFLNVKIGCEFYFKDIGIELSYSPFVKKPKDEKFFTMKEQMENFFNELKKIRWGCVINYGF